METNISRPVPANSRFVSLAILLTYCDLSAPVSAEQVELIKADYAANGWTHAVRIKCNLGDSWGAVTDDVPYIHAALALGLDSIIGTVQLATSELDPSVGATLTIKDGVSKDKGQYLSPEFFHEID